MGDRRQHADPRGDGRRLPPGFLAPEQVRGAAVTPATDVFALGATLAYAATADSPFGHGSSEVMLYRVVHEEPHLVGVPDALAPLVRACLEKDPEDRPSTLQLSMRLKEIAAREAQGLSDGRPPAQRVRTDRPTGRLTQPFPEERAERRTGRTPAPQGAGGRAVKGAPGGPPSRPSSPRNKGGGPSSRPTGGRSGGRPVPRTTGAGRRPSRPDPRLMRQRLIVFVVVTLVVALGIAAAQKL
ncbi:protein kinase [Streptomyces sp. CS62]